MARRLLLVLASLLVCLPALARQRVQGWCQNGGVQINTGGNLSTNKAMGSYPGCTVTVWTTGTTTTVPLFADNSGTVKSDPFTADSNTGLFFFYVDNGRYDIQFSGGGIATPFTLGDFLVNDTAVLSTTIDALAFSATPTFPAGANSIFTMTLTGNVTSSTITGSVAGQISEFSLCQDGTGGRTFSWPASFLRPPTIASGASACTDASFFYDGTNWRQFGATGDTLVPSSAGISGSWPGSPTTTGNWAAQGVNTSCQQNSVLYVGGSITCWSGSDIGAQLNTAYGALPASGGTIYVLPKTGGGSYQYSTPITFTTNHKPVLLAGVGIAGTVNAGMNTGVMLEYTPTTATCAIKLDYTDTSGSAMEAHGIRDITFQNNHTFSQGGTGSSASGVCIGNTNGGAGYAEFSNLSIAGFGVGFDASGGAVNGWGMVCRSCLLYSNTTGVSTISYESFTFLSSKILNNGTGITTTGGGLYVIDGSIDGSSTNPVNLNFTGSSTPSFCEFDRVHFEDQSGGSSHLIVGNGNYKINGGDLLIDSAVAGDYLLNASGGFVSIRGLSVTSNKTLSTGILQATGSVRGVVELILSGTSPGAYVGGASAGNITNQSWQSNNSNAAALFSWEPTFKVPFPMGDSVFTPASVVGLHIRVHGNSVDALRLEDYDNTHTVDIGNAIGGGGFFAIRDITNSKQAFQYTFATQLVTLPGTLALTGSSSGTGTIAAPASGGVATTLPTVTGTLVPTANTGAALIQTKRGVAGCTTGAAAGNSCGTDITVTWGTAFADANYSVVCTGSTPTNVPSGPFVVSASKLAGSVHINYFAITAAAASYSTIDCIAQHD